MMSTVKVYRPNTLKDACAVLAEAPNQIVNGGNALKELEGIQMADDGVRIGGRITWSDPCDLSSSTTLIQIYLPTRRKCVGHRQRTMGNQVAAETMLFTMFCFAKTC